MDGADRQTAPGDGHTWGAIFAPSRPEHWAERHAGTILAACAGMLALVFSLTHTIESKQAARAEPPSLRMVLDTSPLQPPAPQFVAETAATAVDPTDRPIQEPQPEAVSEMVELLEESRPSPASIADWRPRSQADYAAVRALSSRMEQQKSQMRQELESLEVQAHRLRVETAGRAFKLASDGAAQGVIRTLNLDSVGEEAALSVMQRYDIRMTTRYVSGTNPQMKSGFLNAATTSGGTFTDQLTEGVADVFILSTLAISRMASLETQALMERDFDPRRSRIRRVEFGVVVNQNREWDLGVIDIEIETF
ncbi:MAG: hypothetical protein RLY93_14680 [Sumerlaeia bacterium]